MAKQQKALERLLTKPSDFERRELPGIMESFTYQLKRSGGSSRKFMHPVSRATLMMQEPHPVKVLKAYQVKEAIQFLKQEKHI